MTRQCLLHPLTSLGLLPHQSPSLPATLAAIPVTVSPASTATTSSADDTAIIAVRPVVWV